MRRRDEASETVHQGKFLSYERTESGWEYVTRTNAKGCIAILAETDDKRVVLVEQFRPTSGEKCDRIAGWTGG